MFAGLDGVCVGVGARVVCRFNDGLGVRIDHIWGFHQMLDVFELDGWRQSVLTGLRKNSVAGGSVYSSAVDQVVFQCLLSPVGGDAAETEKFSFFVFCLVEAEAIKILDPAVMGFGFPIFDFSGEKEVDWGCGVVFGEVEGVDSSRFRITEDVDGQSVESLHRWNLAERCWKVDSSEV